MEHYNYKLNEYLGNYKFPKKFYSFLIFFAFCVGCLLFSYLYEHNSSIRRFLTPDEYDDGGNVFIMLFAIVVLYPIIYFIIFINAIHKYKFKYWNHFRRHITFIIISTLFISIILKKTIPLTNPDSLFLILSLVFNIYIYYILKEYKRWKKIKNNIKHFDIPENKIKEYIELSDIISQKNELNAVSARHYFEYQNLKSRKLYLFLYHGKIDYLTYEINDFKYINLDYKKLGNENPILIVIVNRNHWISSEEGTCRDLRCSLKIYYLENSKVIYIGKKLFYEYESNLSFFNKYNYETIDRKIKDFFLNTQTDELTLEETSDLIEETNSH
jgi:hypothetical protein